MMKFLKKIQKSIKAHHLLLLGVIVAYFAIIMYSDKKSQVLDLMTPHADKHLTKANPSQSNSTNNLPQPSNPLGENEDFEQVSGLQSRDAGLSNCTKQTSQDPSSLLPKDTNSEWARLNPAGNGSLESVNLLKSGYHVGIDTVGNTLRNANLQVRSEPANPQVNVGPWNNTTISPDLMRVPLELGCGAQ